VEGGQAAQLAGEDLVLDCVSYKQLRFHCCVGLFLAGADQVSLCTLQS